MSGRVEGGVARPRRRGEREQQGSRGRVRNDFPRPAEAAREVQEERRASPAARRAGAGFRGSAPDERQSREQGGRRPVRSAL